MVNTRKRSYNNISKSPLVCSNTGCKFFGSKEYNNLCSICYKNPVIYNPEEDIKQLRQTNPEVLLRLSIVSKNIYSARQLYQICDDLFTPHNELPRIGEILPILYRMPYYNIDNNKNNWDLAIMGFCIDWYNIPHEHRVALCYFANYGEKPRNYDELMNKWRCNKHFVKSQLKFFN